MARTMNRLKLSKSVAKQTGAVLITAMALLMIFTLLGVATMRSNVIDIEIQDSFKNRNNAFQCAEAALRAGEIWLTELAGPAFEVASAPSKAASQVWTVNSTQIQNPEKQTRTLFWDDTTLTWGYGTDLTDTNYQVGCANEPRYFIESLGAIAADSDGLDYETQAKGRSAMYRITAFSTGLDDNATVVLQSTYLQPIN